MPSLQTTGTNASVSLSRVKGVSLTVYLILSERHFLKDRETERQKNRERQRDRDTPREVETETE